MYERNYIYKVGHGWCRCRGCKNIHSLSCPLHIAQPPRGGEEDEEEEDEDTFSPALCTLHNPLLNLPLNLNPPSQCSVFVFLSNTNVGTSYIHTSHAKHCKYNYIHTCCLTNTNFRIKIMIWAFIVSIYFQKYLLCSIFNFCEFSVSAKLLQFSQIMMIMHKTM